MSIAYDERERCTCGGTCAACAHRHEVEVERVVDGHAAPLPPSVRSRMERGFGSALPADLRIHTGGTAASVATRRGLRAFSIGHDVGFAPGEFRPGTLEGDALLAHELAHTFQSPTGGEPAAGAARGGTRSEERGADLMASQAVARTMGIHVGAPARPTGARAMALRGCEVTPGTGLDRGLGWFDDTEEYSLEKYVKLWESDMGRTMTSEEKATLAAGCVGITALNLGGGMPATDECFMSFGDAKDRAEELKKEKGSRPFIFSKRFWSMGKSFPVDADGRVDMSNDTGDGPVGSTNFDYGWYDDVNNTWWHANHCDPKSGSAECRKEYDPKTQPMKVYQSSKSHFSSGRRFGADMQVYCVAFSSISED